MSKTTTNFSAMNDSEFFIECSKKLSLMCAEITKSHEGLASILQKNPDDNFARPMLEFSMQTCLNVVGDLLNAIDLVDDKLGDETNAIFAELRRRFPLDNLQDKSEPPVFRSQWPEGLQAGKGYIVACDDNGRECEAKLSVLISDDGDAWVSMSAYHDKERTAENLNPFPTVRIRTGIGGGRNRRTRQAILWLAKAIELDSQDQSGCLG